MFSGEREQVRSSSHVEESQKAAMVAFVSFRVNVWTSHTSNKRFCCNVKRADFTRLKKTRKSKTRNCVDPRVRQARLKATPEMSQEDLAGRLAAKGILVDRSAVSRIESQERYVMDYEAVALADALKVSVAWLFAHE